MRRTLYRRAKSQNEIQTTQQARTREDAEPKYDVAQDLAALHPPRTTQLYELCSRRQPHTPRATITASRFQGGGGRKTTKTTYWQLAHLEKEEVAPELLEEAPHDQLVDAGREEEGDEGRRVAVHLHRRDGTVVDVPKEEVVDGPGKWVGVISCVCLSPSSSTPEWRVLTGSSRGRTDPRRLFDAVSDREP